MMECAELEGITSRVREQDDQVYKQEWKVFVEYLHIIVRR